MVKLVGLRQAPPAHAAQLHLERHLPIERAVEREDRRRAGGLVMDDARDQQRRRLWPPAANLSVST